MKRIVRTASLGATAVIAGVIIACGSAGAAFAADGDISGEGHVTLNFESTAGAVDIEIWTHNLSTVEAWGAAVVRDVDGTAYPFGPKLYAPDEEKTYLESLPGYTCDDLGAGAIAFAFGFGSFPTAPTDPDWIGEPLSYPDDRITIIGCDPDAEPEPEPEPEPETPPVVTPGTPTTPPVVAPGTPSTQTGTNTVPAAKTDGSEIAHSSSTPLFGFAVTLGAVLAAAVGSRVIGAHKR